VESIQLLKLSLLYFSIVNDPPSEVYIKEEPKRSGSHRFALLTQLSEKVYRYLRFESIVVLRQ